MNMRDYTILHNHHSVQLNEHRSYTYIKMTLKRPIELGGGYEQSYMIAR